ncbi:MAG: hypothetical protein AAF682_02370 [Planctomycetota bacterium]
MAKLSIGKLAGESFTSRIVLQFRVAPQALAAGWAPGSDDAEDDWLVRGFAVVAASYVRRGRVGRFLPRERWSYRLAGRALPTATAGARSIEVEEDRFALRLTVRSGEREELHYRGETCGQPEGSLFASTREAAEFLSRDPELTADKHRAWEPLSTGEIRCLPPELPPEWRALGPRMEFDSAFRQITKPVVFLPAPRGLRDLRARTSPVKPLPSS